VLPQEVNRTTKYYRNYFRWSHEKPGYTRIAAFQLSYTALFETWIRASLHYILIGDDVIYINGKDETAGHKSVRLRSLCNCLLNGAKSGRAVKQPR